MTDVDETRTFELLADRATVGLGTEEQAELEARLAAQPKLDDDSFELAAAAIELAYTDVSEPLPPALRQRVLGRAEDFHGTLSVSPAATADGASGSNVTTFPVRRSNAPDATRRRDDVTRWMGWLAAAAALVMAILGWLPERRPPVDEPPSPDPAAARQALLAEADVELAWAATEDPAATEASGDVVWSTARQTGYMSFRGLPVNDPDVAQYQLWIFDAEQDERYPTDGGVFDVTMTGEAVVPIDAKLRVAVPTLFAITIEKPGGVVVSSRERLVLVAQVG